MATVGGNNRNNRRPSAQAQNEAVLASQVAVNEQIRQTMVSMQNASDMMSYVMGIIVQEDANGSRIGSGPVPAGGAGGGGSRSGNQTRRPSHGGGVPLGHPGPGGGQPGRGLSGLRSVLARSLNSQYGTGAGSQFTRSLDENGMHNGYYEHTADGRVIARGLPGEAGGVSEAELAAAGRRASRGGMIGGLGRGGVLAAARAIPYVGTAIMAAEAVHEAVTFVGDQRAKNAQYQAIYGGSNMGGLGQRVQAAGFGIGQLFSGGGLTWGDSQKAFQGVSALGFQGAQRSRDLNFITSNYSSMGMSVADSLKLITEASKDLNTSLAGLQVGLKSVSQTAVNTGQSAQVARQLYSSNYATLGGQFQGAGSASLAANVTNYSTGLGRGLQGVNLTNLLTDNGQLAALSAYNGGQSITQTYAQIARGGTQTGKYLDQQMQRILGPQTSDRVRARIAQMIKKDPGLGVSLGSSDPSDALATISQQLESEGLVNGLTIQAALGANGVQTTLPQAVELLVAHATVPNRAAANDKLINHNMNQNLKKAQVYGATDNPLPGGDPKFSKAGYGLIGSLHDKTAQAYIKAHPDDVTIRYFNKGVNPVVDLARQSLKGKNVIVKTPGGDRVVSIDTAADLYTDQIAKGTATLADTGQTVRDALGGKHESNYTPAPGQTGDTTKNLPDDWQKVGGAKGNDKGLKNVAGETVSAYNASRQKKAEKNGTVFIEPNQILYNLLNFKTSGNVALANDGAAAGGVPQPGAP
jgi:hypothetical protein